MLTCILHRVIFYLGGIKTMNDSKMLRLPGDAHKTLKILAAATGKTMTELVADLIEQAKKSLFPSKIPTREFTDEEVRKLIADDDKYSRENPELLKWAHNFGKASKK